MQHIADLETIVAGARHGDEDAWQALYRALSPQVMRYLRAHGVEDAPQVLGDAFVDLARALPRFYGDEAALGTLLFRLVHMRLAEGDCPPASASMPLERVLDSAAREVAGGNGARGALISSRMRRRLRLLSEPGQETVLLRVFGHLTEEEARHALAGASGAPPPLRFTPTGRAVLQTASALVDALPLPPTAHLEALHVREAAGSARFLASAGAPVPSGDITHADDGQGRREVSRARRVVGPLLLALFVTAAATGLLPDAVDAAAETVRRGLGEIDTPGGRGSTDSRKPGDRHAERMAAGTLALRDVAARPAPAAEAEEIPAPAAEMPPAGADAPSRVPHGAASAPPAAPAIAPAPSEPAPPPEEPPAQPGEPGDKVVPPEKPRRPDAEDDGERERDDDRDDHEERDD